MNQSYLITGASSGIGKACAKLLSDEGNSLILVARNKERLEKLAEELPGKIYLVNYDLHDLDNIQSIFDICTEKKIKLDGMVYSAGINAECPIRANRISLFQEAMSVNCSAFLEMGKCFYSKRISKDSASIVAVSSIASLLCEKGMAPYSASKAALNAVVKTMAKEFVRRKIRVNAVLPGGVDTPMTAEKKAMLAELADVKGSAPTPGAQEFGLIPDWVVAENIKFLLSNASSYTTGELLVVGGGRNY
ncbi:MAG: SDR family oxidoreductase [Lachnospiraceae bacterium]|nr:SDR family oxidoreductase [Lachnospiraceae bacterium]